MSRKYTVIAFVALLLLWHIFAFFLNRPFLPPPVFAIGVFFKLLADGVLTRHIWVSAYRVLGGTLAAFIFALPTGLAMGRSAKANRLLFPFISLIYPIPKVVFLPVIIVFAGLGDAPKIFLIALVVFFQLAAVIRDSAAGINIRQVQAMRSMQATGFQTLRHLILPCCMPGIFTSLRSTLGASIAVLYIAETFSSFSGLGYYISNRMDCREYGEMYAGIIALSLLGGAIYVVLEFLERWLCKWRKLLT